MGTKPSKILFYLLCTTMVFLGAAFVALLEGVSMIADSDKITDQEKSINLVILSVGLGVCIFCIISIMQELPKTLLAVPTKSN